LVNNNLYKELKITKILLYVKQIYKYVWSFLLNKVGDTVNLVEERFKDKDSSCCILACYNSVISWMFYTKPNNLPFMYYK